MVQIFLTHTPDALENYYGARALSQLSALGDLHFNKGNSPLSTEELIEAAKNCEIIVSDRQTPGHTALFDNASNLIAFVRCAVDIRTVEVESASKNGILVTNASPGFVDSVVELVFGLMVDLSRHISSYTQDFHCGWQPAARMGVQLAGATLGIIGYGAIGKRLAELGLALGMNVFVNDPFKTVQDRRVSQVDQNELLEQADFVVCLAIANDDTENLFDTAEFSLMKKSAYFINVSRGNLVNEHALEEALMNGSIAGAALDVGRAPDQMPSLELARMSNVIATPHIGGLTPNAIESQALETVKQVRKIISGRLPHNAINGKFAERLGRFRGNKL